MPDSFDFFRLFIYPCRQQPPKLTKGPQKVSVAKNSCPRVMHFSRSVSTIAMHSRPHHHCHHQASIVLVRRWAVEAFNKERWGRGGINFFEHTPATIPTTPTIHFALFTDVGITPELRTGTRPDFVIKAVRPTRRSWAQWISISSTCSCA